MNKVILIGRLVKDPDIRTGTNNITIARYALAVERQYRKDNERKADFINCVALGKNGDFAEKYLHKGMKSQLSAAGRLEIIRTLMEKRFTQMTAW